MPVVSNGAFWFSPAEANHAYNENNDFALELRPTYVDYGDRVIYTTHQSDGRLIKQRSKKNPAEKRMVWENYNVQVPKYASQYWDLFKLQEHILVASGLSPYVYIKENVTGEWGSYDTVASNLDEDWIRCRIIMVQRSIRNRGGRTTFDETELLFTIDDTNYEAV